MKIDVRSVCVCLLALLLGACTTATKPPQPAVPQPVEEMPVVDADVTEDETAELCTPPALYFRLYQDRPYIDLGADMLHDFLVAEMAGRRGDLETSVGLYTRLAEQTRDPLVVEYAADIAMFATDYQAAERLARLWVHLVAEDPEPYQILAVTALRREDEDEALRYLRLVMERLFGSTTQKLRLVVRLIEREKDRQTTMRVLERLMVEHMNDPEVLYGFFSNTFNRLGHADKALSLLERVMELNPRHVYAPLSYMAVLLQSRRVAEALDWAESVLEQEQYEHDELRYRYAGILVQEDRYQRALEQFQILERKRPDDFRLLYSIGLLLVQLKELDQAESYFDRLYLIDRNNSDISFFLGKIAEGKKQWDKALSWYQKVHDGSHLTNAHMRVSIVLSMQGKADKALAHLKAMREREQGDPVALIQHQAQILKNAGRLDESLVVLTEGIEQGGYSEEQNFYLLYDRALLAAEELGDMEMAERDLRTILADFPDNSAALNALGYTLATHTKRYDEAYALIREALEKRPDDVYILDSMGWVLYLMGRHEEALDYLTRALSRRHDPAIAAHLGEVLWVMGRQRKAAAIWDAALEEHPEHKDLLKTIQQFSP